MTTTRYSPGSLYTELCERLQQSDEGNNTDDVHSTRSCYNAHTYDHLFLQRQVEKTLLKGTAEQIAEKHKTDALSVLVKKTQIAMRSSDTDLMVKAQQ